MECLRCRQHLHHHKPRVSSALNESTLCTYYNTSEIYIYATSISTCHTFLKSYPGQIKSSDRVRSNPSLNARPSHSQQDIITTECMKDTLCWSPIAECISFFRPLCWDMPQMFHHCSSTHPVMSYLSAMYSRVHGYMQLPCCCKINFHPVCLLMCWIMFLEQFPLHLPTFYSVQHNLLTVLNALA